MAEKLAAGGNCDAWCTKCKMDLAHTIVAMVGAVPAQVECNTCGGKHKYRAPKGVTEPGATATATAKPAKKKRATKGRITKAMREAMEAQAALTARWNALAENVKKSDARKYTITDHFAIDSALTHKKFGLGFVVTEQSFNRIRVLFEDAERTLVVRHGEKPPAG